MLTTMGELAMRQRFGERFRKLSEDEVQAVVTACVEGQVSNARMREMTNKHAVDLTRVLQGLVQKGFLTQDGQKRWATYRLRDEDVRGVAGSVQIGKDSSHLTIDSVHSAENSSHLPRRRRLARLDDLPPDELAELRDLAWPSRSSGKLPTEQTRTIIVQLCAGRYLTASDLSELMGRSSQALRSRFLKPMVDEGLLALRYPEKPNRADQAYTAIDPGREEKDRVS